jgi:3-phenylpropionate/cinnamic acid dioxygenase small subunit
MAYTPEQLSDRAEILDVVNRYAWSIDTRDWDALDTCFAADAYVDYSSNPGGTEGPYREVRGWLEHNLAAFVVMQHLMVNTDITLDGDRAMVRTMMVNPMGARTREGPPHFFYIGGRYDDEFVRTAAGWRIAKRVETLLWFQGSLPPELLR